MFTCKHAEPRKECILYERGDERIPPVRASLCWFCYDAINQNDDDSRNIFVVNADGSETSWGMAS